MFEVSIHNVLPKEIFVLILKKLAYKSICASSQTCRDWYNIINDFKLIRLSLCKYLCHEYCIELNLNPNSYFNSTARGSSIIIAGGYTGRKELSSMEMISEGSTKNFQQCNNLPEALCSLVLHKNNILYFDSRFCYEIVDGSWKKHSTFVQHRGLSSSAVTTNYGTFIFGGFGTGDTYEFLSNESSEWQLGKTKIPGGFYRGCAITLKSKTEIWLIGGKNTDRRILSFNLETHRFAALPIELLVGRFDFQCTFLPNTNKIIVTGGFDLNSTEILDTVDGTVTKGSPMIFRRSDHGIGIVTVDGVDRVATFGGRSSRFGFRNGHTIRTNYLKSVEIYNSESNKWENSKFQLKEGKAYFGFVSVNNKMIMPN